MAARPAACCRWAGVCACGGPGGTPMRVGYRWPETGTRNERTTMTATRHFLLAAGGTGGHMLPAYALAGELIARGHRALLVSDDRGLKIPGAPAEMDTHVLPAGRVHGGPIVWLKAALALRNGRAMATGLHRAL